MVLSTYATTIESLKLVRVQTKYRLPVYLLDAFVTLKLGQDHWQWYRSVKLNGSYQPAKFDRSCSHSLWENANAKVFAKAGKTDIYKHSSLQGHSFLMQVKTEKQLSTTQSDMQGFVYKIGEIVKYLNNNRLKNNN